MKGLNPGYLLKSFLIIWGRFEISAYNSFQHTVSLWVRGTEGARAFIIEPKFLTLIEAKAPS